MVWGKFFNRGFKNAGRYRYIFGVLVKYGFEDILSSIRIHKYFPGSKILFSKKKFAGIVNLSRYQRIRMVLEELGPTYVKFGQIASNRPDLVPPDLIVELEKLQDEAPPIDTGELKKIFDEEFNSSAAEIFEEFEEKPLACASIAQVHAARLKTGEKVAVKVRRPGIEIDIATDVEIMLTIAKLMERYSDELRLYNPTKIVRIFEKTILQEMDFIQESKNIERFRQHYKEDQTISIPTVMPDFTTKRVLTMSLLKGVKISSLYKNEHPELDRKVVASRLTDTFFRQVFINGFFHADPHPGNIFVLKDNVLGILDFGMMGAITPTMREQLTGIFIGVNMKDPRRIIQGIRKMTGKTLIPNERELEARLASLIEEYGYRSLEEIQVSEAIQEMRKVITEFKLEFPPDLFLLMRANVSLEGLVIKLDPTIKPILYLKPYMKKIFRERFRLSAIRRKIYLSALDAGSLIQDIPVDVKEIIDQIKAGKVKVDLEHSGVEPLTNAIDHVSNRIALSIVLAALIVGSSLLVLADMPPKYQEIPLLGLIGFIAAGILGFWLIITIIKKGNI